MSTDISAVDGANARSFERDAQFPCPVCTSDTSSATRSDEDLVTTVVAGNHHVFDHLVERYQKRVISQIAGMVRDRQTAMDLSQVVFLKVFHGLSRFDAQYRFSTWIRRVTTNATIDWMRKQKMVTCSMDTTLTASGVPMKDTFPSGVPIPEHQLELKQLRKTIEEAIDQLPPIYRTIIVYRHLKNWPYAEIAQACDLPLGTVKNRIHRGRRILRESLALDLEEKTD